jgi:hypothetical protein
MAAPVGQALGFGEANFTGPVTMTIADPSPLTVDPVSGLFQINALSVVGGVQTDELLIAHDANVWLQAGAGGTRLYGPDLVLRSLPSEGGVVSDPRPGSFETWMRAGQSGAYFHGDVTIGGTLLGPSGAYQTMGERGDTGPTGADSTVAGPTGPAGVLTVSTTPNSVADPALNITATLDSQALSINYTNLFNKLATYVTSSSLTTTLASYLTTAAATSGYMPTPWAAGRFSSAPAVMSSSGQKTFTVSRVTTGYYAISWTGNNPAGSNYAVLLSVRGSGSVAYGIPGPQGFGIYNVALGGTARADITADASFMTIP